MTYFNNKKIILGKHWVRTTIGWRFLDCYQTAQGFWITSKIKNNG